MLKPIPLQILLALAEGDSHGYAVMQAIRENGGVDVQTASFYRHLGRLIDEGWVAEASGRRDGDDPRRGTYYRITARGRQALAEEKRRLTDLVAQMKKVGLAPRKASV